MERDTKVRGTARRSRSPIRAEQFSYARVRKSIIVPIASGDTQLIRLYDSALSGNCHKVHMLLSFLGLQYETVPVN